LIDAGGQPKPLDLMASAQTEADYMNPLRTPTMATKAITGVQNIVEGKSGTQHFDQYSQAAPPVPTPGQKPDANAPGGLGPTMEDAFAALQDFLTPK
jgi:hypothetical protein